MIKYLNGENLFGNCQSGPLRDLDEAATLEPDILAGVEEAIADLTPAEKFDYALSYFDVASDDIAPEILDRIALFIILDAARDGHMESMNEIGAAQLYCYFGVQQNIPEALVWLENAAALGDELAMSSLGYVYLLGLTGQKDEDKGMAFIRACAKKGDPDCRDLLKIYDDKVGILEMNSYGSLFQ